jgi:serine protease Do
LPVATQVLTTDIADAVGAKGRTGVRVTQVYPGTSADKAGLKVGDLIVGLDGEEISASQPEDSQVLPAMIRQYKIGTAVKLTVLRDKKQLTVPVVLEEARPLAREMKKYRDEDFEFAARDMAFQDRVEKNIDKNIVGVYVEEVTEGGWAALGSLHVGDLIRSVGGQPVSDVAALSALMRKIAAQKPKFVVLRVQRGVEEMFIELEADWSGTK